MSKMLFCFQQIFSIVRISANWTMTAQISGSRKWAKYQVSKKRNRGTQRVLIKVVCHGCLRWMQRVIFLVFTPSVYAIFPGAFSCQLPPFGVGMFAPGVLSQSTTKDKPRKMTERMLLSAFCSFSLIAFHKSRKDTKL